MVIHKSSSDLLVDPALETKLGRMSGLGDIFYYLNVYKEYLLNIFSLKNFEMRLHLLAISKCLKPRPRWICDCKHPGKPYFNAKHLLTIHLTGRENTTHLEPCWSFGQLSMQSAPVGI